MLASPARRLVSLRKTVARSPVDRTNNPHSQPPKTRPSPHRQKPGKTRMHCQYSLIEFEPPAQVPLLWPQGPLTACGPVQNTCPDQVHKQFAESTPSTAARTVPYLHLA